MNEVLLVACSLACEVVRDELSASGQGRGLSPGGVASSSPAIGVASVGHLAFDPTWPDLNRIASEKRLRAPVVIR